MSYCLNPACSHPQNSNQDLVCQSCGAKLLLRERYRGIKSIGQGGFGKTFLGIDQDKPSKPPCVIKLFYPSSQGTNSIVKATELFNQEAERLESLGKHPQIPELFAHFAQESKLYLVQEYIDGKNLAQKLQDEGIFSETQIREFLTELLPILQFIHENNVIHRDIKPENIITRRIFSSSLSQKYVLVDFGAARYVTGTALLKTGTTIGDVRYMADEQLQGKATFASDIYSLGLTCLHLLTHVTPWDLFDSSEKEWVWRDYITNPVSKDLGQVLDKMVQKSTKRRFQSAVEVLGALNPSRVEQVIQSSKVETHAGKRYLQVLRQYVAKVIQPSEVETPPVSSVVSLSSNWKIIEVKGKYGYKDEKGKVVIRPQFDSAGKFHEGLAVVRINRMWGYIAQTGKVVIPPRFNRAKPFSEGLARVKLDGKSGYIDKTGKIVTQMFDDVSDFSEGLARVKLDGKSGYIDKTGKVVIQMFDDVSDFSEGLAKVKLNDKYGYIDKTGKIFIKPQFDGVYGFSEGLAIVILGRYPDCKYGYIDKTGKIVTQMFDWVSDFSEGLAIVRLDGKYGYIDITGKIVIPLQFKQVENFKNGRAKVTKLFLGLFDKEGYIDKTGKWIE